MSSAKKAKRLTIEQRWEQGVPHDPRSESLYKAIADLDFKECGDSFGFKCGGDGDNGENLMYLLDVYFEEHPEVKIPVPGIPEARR